jgi:hypothetical protein
VVKKLLEIQPDNWNYTSTPTMMRDRPKLAPYVAEMISIGSLIEQAWATLLSEMAKFDPSTAVAILDAVPNSTFQTRMIEAVARENLSDGHLQLTTRHSFAHWVWAISPDWPDALILNKHTAGAKFHAAVKGAMGDHVPRDRPTMPNMAEHALVYFEEDLQDACEEYSEVLQAVMAFNRVLGMEGFRTPAPTELAGMAMEEFESALAKIAKRKAGRASH